MTLPSIYRTRAPIVRTADVPIVHRVDVDGLGTIEPLRFTRTIQWIRETETRWRMMIGDREVDHGSTHGDYYGFMTSWKDPVETAKEQSVGLPAGVIIEVVTKITDLPVVDPPEWRKEGDGSHRLGRQFMPVPRGWFVDDEATAAWLAAPADQQFEFTPTPAGAPAEPVEFIIWSSANTVPENMRLFEALGPYRIPGIA